MQVLAVLEPMLVQAFKNGMSFKQVKARVPALAARKMGVTEAKFHDLLEEASGPRDRAFDDLAQRVISNFTPSEQRAIALRK